MSNSIIEFFSKKQFLIVILLNALFGALLYLYLNFIGSLTSKYVVYFFIAPFFLFILFRYKKSYVKLAAPLFVLIFVENIIISRIPVGPFLRIGITLIFGLTVFASILWHKKKYAYPKYTKILFSLFILTAIISLVIGSANGKEYLYVNIADLITYYMGFILFFYIGYQSIDNVNDVYKFILIILIFGALTAAGHLFSITTGINLELMRGQEMLAASRDLSEGNWRYGGFFGNVNSMSAFYVMLIPGGLVLLFNEVKISMRIIAVISILIMIISTFLGASRGALLYIALNIILSLFFLKLNLKQVLIGTGFIIILIFGVQLVIGNYLQEFFDRAIEEITRKGTESPREIIWIYTLKIIWDYPLGVGLTWHTYSPLLMKYGNISWANPHSLYLQMIVQTGWLGFISFILIVLQILIFNIKAYKKVKTAIAKNSLAFIFLMMTGLMFTGITDPNFTNQYKLNYIFGTVLGMSLSYSYRNLGLNRVINTRTKSQKKF